MIFEILSFARVDKIRVCNSTAGDYLLFVSVPNGREEKSNRAYCVDYKLPKSYAKASAVKLAQCNANLLGRRSVIYRTIAYQKKADSPNELHPI